MERKPCYGKLALKEPETMKGKGCINCPHWNGCLTGTWITKGKGLEGK